MKNKVLIIDTLSYSTFHEVFNSSVVYMCALIFDRVELSCSNSTYRTIEKLITRYNPAFDADTINYKQIKVIERDDTIGGFIKYMLSGWLNFWYFLIAPRSVQIIYTNNNPLSLWWVTLINMLLRKDVAIFCHGELDLLIRKPHIWKPSFYYKHIFRLLFRYGLIGRHTKLLVLGDSILGNLQPMLNKHNRKQVLSIEHPYFFVTRTTNHTTLKRPIRIGTVGALTYAKGLQSLLNLSHKIDESEIKLSVVGRVMETIDVEQYPNIQFLEQQGEYIPRDEFERAIEELDYILFLYPVDSYGFIASGAIFDAMDMGKPIITLKNDYFTHILKLPIGYVVQDEEQVLEIIRKISARTSSQTEYGKFLDNIEQLKKYYTVETVAQDFKQKLAH